jgi:N-acetylneuraminic acid mutarotase
MLAFDNKLWIIGGATGTTDSSDVWYSSDGTTWTRATTNAGFGLIDEHSSVVFDNKMWVFGGYSSLYSGVSNNAWYSSDGISWTQATASAGWNARGAHTSVVFNDKVWIMGGEEADGTKKNDVWEMLRKYA